MRRMGPSLRIVYVRVVSQGTQITGPFLGSPRWRFRVLSDPLSGSYNPHISPLSTLRGLELGSKYSYNWVTKYHEPPSSKP